MNENKLELEEESTEALKTIGQGAGSLAVQEALEQRRQAILEKLQRDNADAGM